MLLCSKPTLNWYSWPSNIISKKQEILKMNYATSSIPIIDVSSLVTNEGNQMSVASALRRACTEFGFFYIVGHGIDEQLQKQLEAGSRQFFAQDNKTKMQIPMALGGKAWRGYFPVGDELTSGKPDLKEGLYFGIELNEDDPRVQAGLPMHGPNLFPANMPDFKKAVLDYMAALKQLGHQLMKGLALSLGLEANYFVERYTGEPLCLFRIFHYPNSGKNQKPETTQWGVGEHTDYGVLTILKQDDAGGLQIKSKGQWLEAPVVPGAFVCNIGDMLDRMTGGYYRSTPHRVLNTAGRGRLSYPFFFDPNMDAEIHPISLDGLDFMEDDKTERWDGASVHDFQGTYGDYILGKVGKVFPGLKKKVE